MSLHLAAVLMGGIRCRVAESGTVHMRLRLSEEALERAVPRCPHFGPCGGCMWQDLDYTAQLRAKHAIVTENLGEINGAGAEVRPVIGLADPWYYRNKMEFSFQPPARLGLHRRGRWDELVDLHTCFLQSPRTAEIIHAVRTFVQARNIPCYDRRTHEGLLRHLVIREGKSTGELLIALITAPGPFPQAEEFGRMLTERFPDLTGSVWAINPFKGDTAEVQDLRVLHGRPFIHERLHDLTFKLGLRTFFQTNTVQAERMVDIVCEFAEPRELDRVIDLYCGIGTFALSLAPRAAAVTGFEVVPASVEAAQENAALNGIENATFHTADARRFEHFIAPGEDPDIVVLDPPRAGAGAYVMRALGRVRPRRVVYISCNPMTLAADLRALTPAGYTVRSAQPIDLFPQTDHVECVVLIERTTP